MKILVTLGYYLPNVSGLTNYVKNLSEGLTTKSNSITILTSRHLKKLPENEVIKSIHIKRVWSPIRFGRGVLMPTYPIQAFKAVSNTDIVNLHLPQFEGFVTAIIAKLLGKKIVVTYHCDLSFWKGFLNVMTVMFVYISNFISCWLADVIVSNTEDYASSSVFLRFFKDKLTYIYPPVKIGSAQSGVLKKYNKTKYKIGFVGRISKEKGVATLLQTIPFLKKNISNFKIFFVGPINEVIGGSQMSDLDKLIKEYRNDIIFLDKISDAELYGFYKEIDVLVLPSTERQESFGMVQIEAMLSGCPVIVTDLPGVRVPVKETGMGIIVQKNKSLQIADAITKILKAGKYYKKLRDKVAKKYNVNYVVFAYEKIFRKLLI